MTEKIPGQDDIRGPELGPQQQPEIPEQGASGKDFAASMDTGAEAAKGATAPSPAEITGAGREVTPQTLENGMNVVAKKAGAVEEQLTPERFNEMTSAQKTLLDTKLNQFTQHVKGLSEQVGASYDSPPEPSKGAKMLEGFIGLLTHGQHQLQTVAQHMGKKSGGQISVADMLRAQAKLVAADRAINFASAVAGKATDFIKQIMQTQI